MVGLSRKMRRAEKGSRRATAVMRHRSSGADQSSVVRLWLLEHLVGDSLPVPEDQLALRMDHCPEHPQTQQAQKEDQRKDPRGVDHGRGHTDQLAEPLATAQELPYHRADHD